MNITSASHLHLAISRRDTNAVKKLLDEGANVNITDQQYRTPLCRAIKDVNCSNEIVKLLIEAKCDINAKSRDKAPIYYAIRKGHHEVFELLLASGATIDDNSELLHIAAERNNTKACRMLIDYGINVNARDRYGRTAIYSAASSEFMYSWDTNEEIIQLLIQNGTDLDARDINGQTALHFAISHGYKETVKQLLDKGADVDIIDERYRTPLCLAIEKGYSYLAELLVKAKCDINAKSNGRTPIYYAIDSETNEALRLLLASGANIDDNSELLHVAAERDNIKACRMLIDHGIDVNARDQDGRTALHCAAFPGGIDCPTENKEIIKLLIQKGTDLYARDEIGQTVLHYAIESGADPSHNLFEYDFDIDAQDYNGDTPLHIAARGNQYKVVRLLLDKGYDVNTTNNPGKTPLECAIHEIDQARLRESSCRPPGPYRGHRCSERYESVAVEIREHIRKLYAAGLYVSEKNLSIVHPKHSDPVIISCGRELKKIRCIKVGDTSLYDALIKCRVPSLGEELTKVLELINYDEEFPLYCKLMKNNFKNHKLRSNLISLGKESFCTINKGKKLPIEIVEKILCELGNRDLKNLISCKKVE